MPLFDFQCTGCQNIFEATLSFGSKTKPVCPACGTKKTEKLLTPPAFHFKGGGFYKTDTSKLPVQKKKEETKQPPETPKAESKKDVPKKD